MNKKELKEQTISLFIYQKLQEGYTIFKTRKDEYEFRILSRKYNSSNFLTLDILPFVKYTDVIQEGGIKIEEHGIKILN
jgi:hypothetical protein